MSSIEDYPELDTLTIKNKTTQQETVYRFKDSVLTSEVSVNKSQISSLQQQVQQLEQPDIAVSYISNSEIESICQ